MSHPYPIDKGIPMPPKPVGEHERIRDTLLLLEVGESFECSADYAQSMVAAGSVPLAPKKFAVRPGSTTGRARIWRTA